MKSEWVEEVLDEMNYRLLVQYNKHIPQWYNGKQMVVELDLRDLLQPMLNWLKQLDQ